MTHTIARGREATSRFFSEMHDPILSFQRSPERKMLMMPAARNVRSTDWLVRRNDEPVQSIANVITTYDNESAPVP